MRSALLTTATSLRSQRMWKWFAGAAIAGLVWGALPLESATAEPLNYSTRRTYQPPSNPCLSSGYPPSSYPSSTGRYSSSRQIACASYPRNGSVRNSILINPTIINSPIRDSVLINPTIINPSRRVYQLPTRSRTVYYYPY